MVNGEAIEYVETHHIKEYNVDDIIPIKYDPSNPHIRHTFYNAQSPWAKGLPQFIIAAALMVGGIVFFCLAFLE